MSELPGHPLEVYGPWHDMGIEAWEDIQREGRTETPTGSPLLPRELELHRIREELKDIIPAQEGGELPPVILADAPPKDDSPLGVLQEKELKRKALQQKESSPRQYTEMLVVVNDLQLLRSADGEAIGAFMKWLSANREKVTHLVANGDILDFEAQTGFSKMPDEMGPSVALDEIEAGKWFFRTVSEMTPHAEKVLLWGNHENRFLNMMKDQTNGVEAWVQTPDEMFKLREFGWKEVPYGQNQFYEWHERIFWHGHRAGAKSDIAKLELLDTGLVSTTTGHVNRNMYHEERDAKGRLASGITHGGFSKDSLGFMKKANTGWSQGFGIYFWDKKVGEQPYSVIMKHGNPRFIGPDGLIYDGSGFNLRQEIGLDPRGRGRPRKI